MCAYETKSVGTFKFTLQGVLLMVYLSMHHISEEWENLDHINKEGLSEYC